MPRPYSYPFNRTPVGGSFVIPYRYGREPEESRARWQRELCKLCKYHRDRRRGTFRTRRISQGILVTRVQ